MQVFSAQGQIHTSTWFPSQRRDTNTRAQALSQAAGKVTEKVQLLPHPSPTSHTDKLRLMGWAIRFPFMKVLPETTFRTSIHSVFAKHLSVCVLGLAGTLHIPRWVKVRHSPVKQTKAKPQDHHPAPFSFSEVLSLITPSRPQHQLEKASKDGSFQLLQRQYTIYFHEHFQNGYHSTRFLPYQSHETQK